MIVSDTNLIVYLHVDSEFTPRARQVYALDPDWVSPPVARSEAANVLATLTRRRWLDAATATSVLERMEPGLSAGLRDIPMKAALALAIEHGISAYDAQFVVLAKSLGIRLVTEDGRLTRSFPDIAVSMNAFIRAAGPWTLRESRPSYPTRRKKQLPGMKRRRI